MALVFLARCWCFECTWYLYILTYWPHKKGKWQYMYKIWNYYASPCPLWASSIYASPLFLTPASSFYPNPLHIPRLPVALSGPLCRLPWLTHWNLKVCLSFWRNQVSGNACLHQRLVFSPIFLELQIWPAVLKLTLWGTNMVSNAPPKVEYSIL